jgi:hypothetical protein
MTQEKNKTLSEFIKNEYSVPPLRSDLSATASGKVFGLKKKVLFPLPDAWFYLVVVAVCIIVSFFAIVYFNKIPVPPFFALLLIPAMCYWVLSLKEISVFRRRIMSV